MERKERIAAMEARMNRARAVLDVSEEVLDRLEAQICEMKALTDYYGSDDWYADREADERGELPADMPRGVLGEDYVYGIETSRRELAVRMIELAARILKN